MHHERDTRPKNTPVLVYTEIKCCWSSFNLGSPLVIHIFRMKFMGNIRGTAFWEEHSPNQPDLNISYRKWSIFSMSKIINIEYSKIPLVLFETLIAFRLNIKRKNVCFVMIYFFIVFSCSHVYLYFSDTFKGM